MNKLIALFSIVLIISCKDSKSVISAQEIVNNSIQVSGGEKYTKSNIAFDFRDIHYTSEINGSKEDTFAFMNKLQLVDISNNLGDAKSLITHPATTTHSNLEEEDRLKIDITQSMCRLSVGIENADDLIKDLGDALA